MPSRSNPVIARLLRAEREESVHRGAWVLVDVDGSVVDGCGDPEQPVFARSSTKSIQAVPLIESGAADALGATTEELAVAIASHAGEAIHANAVRSLLARAGLGPDHLQCGPQRPAAAGDEVAPARITNNCSGKHAGFLATAVHLGDDPASYLDPSSEVQRRVHRAVLDMTGAGEADVATAIDGCSAPTFHLPLRALATGLARMANPESLVPHRRDACRRIVAAAAAHPELVGGMAVPRFDSIVMRATGGRLFAKVGAEGVQTVGVVGAGIGFAAKVDDGGKRSLPLLTIAVLARTGLLGAAELDALGSVAVTARHNFDGIEVGRHEICEDILPSQR